MLSDKILRFRLLRGLDQWILYNLRSKFGRQEIEQLATGNQESMRNIGQQRIRAIRMPLPPIVERNLIAAEIDRRSSFVREVETQVDVNLKRADRLRQGILKKSFSGKLLNKEGVCS
jgi:type I restriction enzyme S subunit